MRRTLLLLLVSFVLLALGCPSPAVAGSQVPFRGIVTGQAISTPTGDPNIVFVHFEGTGQASHLGRFTAVAEYFLHLDRFTGTLSFQGGIFVFQAANGDTIYGGFSGQAQPTGTPGVLTLTAAAPITGGTGRFAGATGAFTAQGVVDLNTDEILATFGGTLSSPGSLK